MQKCAERVALLDSIIKWKNMILSMGHIPPWALMIYKIYITNISFGSNVNYNLLLNILVLCIAKKVKLCAIINLV